MCQTAYESINFYYDTKMGFSTEEDIKNLTKV